MTETPSKRIKLDNESSNEEIPAVYMYADQQKTIKPIFSDEFIKPVSRCYVYACTISDPTLTSAIISELSRLLPLNKLNHLRRVHKNKLILCSLDAVIEFLNNSNSEIINQVRRQASVNENNEIKSHNLLQLDDATNRLIIEELFNKHNISRHLISTLCIPNNIEIIIVAAHQPLLRWQLIEADKSWPCKFHPNKYIESMCDQRLFNTSQSEFHNKIINICKDLGKKINKCSVGVTIDPKTLNVIGIGFDETEYHPLMHCAMVLIDSVARSQNGGAWNNQLNVDSETYNLYNMHPTKAIEYALNSIKKDKNETEISHQTQTITHADNESFNDTSKNDCSTKDGPYLCTGYDVYLLREPCLMCAMALTHSRVRRIFFHTESTTGAIKTLTKLHTIKALNHHFEVFQIGSS